jgi:hypothetical protein
MPSTSRKQHNFLAAIANSPSFAKKAGVPQSVGSDFVQADKGRKFAKGGDMKESKMNAGFMAMVAKKKAGAKKQPEAMPKMAKGKPFKSGGFTKSADGAASKGLTRAQMPKMKSGGSC